MTTRANVTKNNRKKIFERDGNKCLYPNCNRKPLTIDHIVPLSKGGTNRASNLQTLCRYHNNKKGDHVINYVTNPIELDIPVVKNMRFKKDIFDKVNELAKKNNRSFNNMVETILINELSK